MLIRFTKGKRADVLTCTRDNGTVTWMHERPGFVLHDLAHYAVETGFGYALGFFGLVAQGWDLSSSDFGRDPSTKQRCPWPGGAQEPVEYVVSLFQRRFTDVQSPDEIRAALALYCREVPPRFTDERIEATRAALERLHHRWEEVPAGDSLELRFPAEPAAAP